MGKDKSIARPVALNMLFRSDLPNRSNLFRNILDDDAEDPGMRHDAALFLARMGDAESLNALRKSAVKVSDPVALKAVVKGLARLGNEKDLEILAAVARSTHDDYVKRQASFGSSLLSYRLGIKGNELAMPKNFLKMADFKSLAIDIKSPTAKVVTQCLDALKQEVIGIGLSKDSMIQLDCFNRTSFIIQNANLKEKSNWKAMQEQKTLYGIMASRISEHENYTGSAWIFTTPAGPKKLEILITRMTGEPLMAGKAAYESADLIHFEVDGLDETGNVAINLGGVIRSGKMEISKATSGLKVSRKNTPLAVVKPSMPA